MKQFLIAGAFAVLAKAFDSDDYVEGTSPTVLAAMTSNVMTSSSSNAENANTFTRDNADVQTGVSTQLAATQTLVSQMKEANQSTANVQESNRRLVAAKAFFKS